MPALPGKSGSNQRLADALWTNDVAEAVRRYRAYRSDPRCRYVDTENELNSFGYRFLEQKRFDQAISILALNAAEHPHSGNVYDSLGEAYLLSGRRMLQPPIIENGCDWIQGTRMPRPCWSSCETELAWSGRRARLAGAVAKREADG